MKKSRLIIITFFSLLILGIVCVFISTKLQIGKNEEKVIKDEIELPPFSVIVAGPGTMFTVQENDTFKLSVRYPESDKNKAMPYIVRNDTLFVTENKMQHIIVDRPDYFYAKGLFMDISCKNIVSVVGEKGCRVTIRNFCSDSLAIIAHGGAIGIDNKDISVAEQKKKKLNYSVSASDSSSVDFRNASINNLMVQLCGANMNISDSKITVLKADIKKKSTFNIVAIKNHPDRLLINKDKSSDYNIN